MLDEPKIFLDKSEKYAITGGPDDDGLPPITERWLEWVMGDLARSGGTEVRYIPRRDVFYVRSLIREKFGIVLPVLEVERMLIEEGLMEPEHR